MKKKGEKNKFIKELKGNSGCKVILYNEGNRYFVRKISKDKDYNKRLEKQMMKQKAFYEKFSTKSINCPKIFCKGYLGGKFYFDMEYIKGITLIEYIAKANLEDLKKIAKKLLEILELMKKMPKKDKISLKDKFIDKINSLQKKIPLKYEDLLKLLKKKSEKLPEVLSTFCHGDLTLENIIYDDNTKRYYLIDFQDLFAEHYWFDISSLFQDIDEGWYMFKHPELDAKMVKIKMDYLKQRIIGKIEKEYSRHHSIFISLKFLRILPYTPKEVHEYLTMVILKNISS